jgi:signal peptidase I
MGRRRSAGARLGIALLNLLAPGLGLLRVGDTRRGLIIYGFTVAVLLALIAAFASTSNLNFGAYAAIVVIALAATLVAYVMAIWWTWQKSEFVTELRPVASRWYSIVAAFVLACLISWILTGISQSLYRNFYLPSEAMEPTLLKNDRLVASMRKPEDLRRGDIVLVRAASGTTYVKRIAGLPGDRIALKDGAVFIDGQAARRVHKGTRRVSYPYMEPTEASVLQETFPGESAPHLIQDLGQSVEDDMREQFVAPRHVFVLGDNRDDSADSRISRTMGGLEQVPIDDVVGRALFLYWPFDKMGRSLKGSRR